MEKIHENMCFDVYENIQTCLFTYVFLYFLHLVLNFTPHYIIMVKGLLCVLKIICYHLQNYINTGRKSLFMAVTSLLDRSRTALLFLNAPDDALVLRYSIAAELLNGVPSILPFADGRWVCLDP